MKKTIKITLISLITLFTVNSFSQGNLQFNRARLETLSYFLFQGSTTKYDTIVVPTGKVLKITSTSLTNRQSSTSDNFFSTTAVYSYLDNLSLCCGSFPAEYPIWLNEGKHILSFYHVSSSSYYRDFKFTFSGIEFNVVP